MVGIREEQRAATRQQILRAGLELVRQSGFGKTTTGEIAKLVGKAHGTIFVHFATRDALVIEIVKAIGSGLTDHLTRISSDSFGLDQFLDAHLAVLRDAEEFGRGEDFFHVPAMRAARAGPSKIASDLIEAKSEKMGVPSPKPRQPRAIRIR